MADRSIDDAVDELRRKARRRLVGAIVLALGAAILIPLLFEKDPKPLGEEVSIQIPPVDDSKFVSRLSVDNRGLAKAESKADSPSGGADAGVKSDGKADAKTGAKAESKAETKSEPKPEAKPEPKADAKANAKSDEKAQPTTNADAEGADAKSDNSKNTDAVSVEGFVVQLAAFTDDKGANALANRLKKAGYSAYTEPVETARGTLWRVRVGGYPTRAEAKAAAAKLKAEGHNGIIASAK